MSKMKKTGEDTKQLEILIYCWWECKLVQPHWKTTWKGFFFFSSSCLFAISWATASVAYGVSQARGLIGAVATSLRQSHSNEGSEPHLETTPQFTAMLDP